MPLHTTEIAAYIALIIAPIVGAGNAIFARVAFTENITDTANKEVLKPITMAVFRTVVACINFFIIHYFAHRYQWKFLIVPKYREVPKPSKPNEEPVQKQVEQHSQTVEHPPNYEAEAEQDKEQQGTQQQQPREQLHVEIPAVSPTTLPTTSIKSAAMTPAVKTPTAKLFPPVISHDPAIMDTARSVLLGIYGVGLNMILYLSGIALTDGTVTAAMICLTPGLTFVIGLMTDEDIFCWVKLLSTVMVCVGNALLTHAWRPITGNFNDASGRRDPSYYLGVLLLFCNATCFAAYLVFQRRVVARVAPIDFMVRVYSGATAFLLLASLVPTENTVTRQLFFGKLSGLAWGSILYGGFLQATGSYFAMSYAMSRVDNALIVAMANNSTPIFIVIGAFFILNEDMDYFEAIGAVVTLLGLVILITAPNRSIGSASAPIPQPPPRTGGGGMAQQYTQTTTTTTTTTSTGTGTGGGGASLGDTIDLTGGVIDVS